MVKAWKKNDVRVLINLSNLGLVSKFGGVILKFPISIQYLNRESVNAYTTLT